MKREGSEEGEVVDTDEETNKSNCGQYSDDDDPHIDKILEEISALPPQSFRNIVSLKAVSGEENSAKNTEDEVDLDVMRSLLLAGSNPKRKEEGELSENGESEVGKEVQTRQTRAAHHSPIHRKVNTKERDYEKEEDVQYYKRNSGSRDDENRHAYNRFRSSESRQRSYSCKASSRLRKRDSDRVKKRSKESRIESKEKRRSKAYVSSADCVVDGSSAKPTSTNAATIHDDISGDPEPSTNQQPVMSYSDIPSEYQNGYSSCYGNPPSFIDTTKPPPSLLSLQIPAIIQNTQGLPDFVMSRCSSPFDLTPPPPPPILHVEAKSQNIEHADIGTCHTAVNPIFCNSAPDQSRSHSSNGLDGIFSRSVLNDNYDQVEMDLDSPAERSDSLQDHEQDETRVMRENLLKQVFTKRASSKEEIEKETSPVLVKMNARDDERGATKTVFVRTLSGGRVVTRRISIGEESENTPSWNHDHSHSDHRPFEDQNVENATNVIVNDDLLLESTTVELAKNSLMRAERRGQFLKKKMKEFKDRKEYLIKELDKLKEDMINTSEEYNETFEEQLKLRKQISDYEISQYIHQDDLSTEKEVRLRHELDEELRNQKTLIEHEKIQRLRLSKAEETRAALVAKKAQVEAQLAKTRLSLLEKSKREKYGSMEDLQNNDESAKREREETERRMKERLEERGRLRMEQEIRKKMEEDRINSLNRREEEKNKKRLIEEDCVSQLRTFPKKTKYDAYSYDHNFLQGYEPTFVHYAEHPELQGPYSMANEAILLEEGSSTYPYTSDDALYIYTRDPPPPPEVGHGNIEEQLDETGFLRDEDVVGNDLSKQDQERIRLESEEQELRKQLLDTMSGKGRNASVGTPNDTESDSLDGLACQNEIRNPCKPLHPTFSIENEKPSSSASDSTSQKTSQISKLKYVPTRQFSDNSTSTKLSITGCTESNSISKASTLTPFDAMAPICYFDLFGICKDELCQCQHVNSTKKTDRMIIEAIARSSFHLVPVPEQLNAVVEHLMIKRKEHGGTIEEYSKDLISSLPRSELRTVDWNKFLRRERNTSDDFDNVPEYNSILDSSWESGIQGVSQD